MSTSIKFTVFGSKGFIGSHLVKRLGDQNLEVFCPERDFIPKPDQNLGHVIYCIGLTSDFRKFPLETVEAHVCKLLEIIKNSTFESFLYLSSSRVYLNANDGNETADLCVNPNEFNDLYNLSKLMGESICISMNNPTIRAVRLSNVIGYDFESDNFIYSLIKSAVDLNEITLQSNINNAKDYVMIEDVTNMLVEISMHGKKNLYNLASGMNISNRQILDTIEKNTACKMNASELGQIQHFPVIDITNLKNEFNFMPDSILDKIPDLIDFYKSNTTK